MRHLALITLPFIAGVSVFVLLVGHPIEWWQVALIMAGQGLWDLGWHGAGRNHPPAPRVPVVRITGFLLAAAGIWFAI